ncbi:hypothetical protein CLU79DRAFT_856259 [Phycomyces nitens]|nr:hypothetical protein CLU79DRAFT_856259 [Phycomyces nitens]
MYIDIKVRPDQYDVNIEPNKTAVVFHNRQSIINLMESLLNKIYVGIRLSSSESNASSVISEREPSLKDLPTTQEVNDSASISVPDPGSDSDSDYTDNSNHEEKASPWEFTMLSSAEEDEVYELESTTGSSESVHWAPYHIELPSTSSSKQTLEHSPSFFEELQGLDVWDIDINSDRSNDRVDRGTNDKNIISTPPSNPITPKKRQTSSEKGGSSRMPVKRVSGILDSRNKKRPNMGGSPGKVLGPF